MINGDTLTTLNFSDLINYHQSNKPVATIALNRRGTYIDSGIVELGRDNRVKDYIEKPTIDHLVSMGVYIFEPTVLDYIKPTKYLDFPDLIKELISKCKTVKGYVHDGYWLDIGRADDYERANLEIEDIYPKLFGA